MFMLNCVNVPARTANTYSLNRNKHLWKQQITMNIKFTYLYRDGANYKNYNQVVFANPNKLLLEQIQKLITGNLIDECWFIAKDWDLPDMHFKEYNWDNEIDHYWHEFSCLGETTEAETIQMTIDKFIETIAVKQ